jgi:hypothetical protein
VTWRAVLVALMLSGCVISPLPQNQQAPVVTCETASIPPPLVPKPVWPDACVEDWYLHADLPACVKDWVLDIRDEQKDIVKKRQK